MEQASVLQPQEQPQVPLQAEVILEEVQEQKQAEVLAEVQVVELDPMLEVLVLSMMRAKEHKPEQEQVRREPQVECIR